jgi:hypothetical protein
MVLTFRPESTKQDLNDLPGVDEAGRSRRATLTADQLTTARKRLERAQADSAKPARKIMMGAEFVTGVAGPIAKLGSNARPIGIARPSDRPLRTQHRHRTVHRANRQGHDPRALRLSAAGVLGRGQTEPRTALDRSSTAH